MMTAPLDNPIWHALQTRHGEFAQGGARAARYPAEIAPFLGVPDEQADANANASAAIAALVGVDETVYLLGRVPELGGDWSLKAFAPLAQMICTSRLPEIDGPAVIELSEQHHADVMALTALVYPHYFRRRTTALGRYFGIYREGRLAAMIGERMAPGEFQEISAVCTHPDFNGRGYARQLLIRLSNDTLARGRTPFLHVSHENVRAKKLYEQNGYSLRRDIGFWSLRRG